VPDKITSFLSEVQTKKKKSENLLEQLLAEVDFLSEVKSCSPAHNNSIEKCLNILEKIMINDERTVLTERQFYKAFVELLDFVSPEKKNELLKLLLDSQANALEVTVGYTEEGWVYVRAPGFLPTEKDLWLSSEFFVPIQQKLTQLNPERKCFIQKCFIVTVQNIEEGTTRVLRDSDNREYKNLNNMLARSFLEDDTPYYCDFVFATIFKDVSCVEAFIIPENELEIFIKRFVNRDITPKTLLKTMPFPEKMV